MNSKVVTVNDFDKICRICLEEEETLYPMRRTYANEKKVSDLMEYTLTSDTKNRTLPQNICKLCLRNLCHVYEFKKQYQDTEAKLKELLEMYKKDTRDDDFKSEITVIEEPLNLENNVNEDSKSNIILINETVNNCGSNMSEEQNKPKGICLMPLKCRMCDYVTQSREDLNKHRQSHSHVTCEICKKKVIRRVITNHMYSHTKPFQCDICTKRFSSRKDVKRHKLTHTGERPHRCIVCGKTFTQAVNLRFHEQRKHGDGIAYERSKNLTERTFLCSECGKCYFTKTQLEMHSRTHTGEKPYACNLCEKTFSTPTSLRTHKLTHSDLRPYLCNFCAKSFKTKNVLVDHLRTHTGEKLHLCQFCDKKFYTKSLLTVHIRTHTGEKPYVCNVCERGFCDSSHLKKHVQRMHKKDFSEKEAESKEELDCEDVSS